MRISWRILRSKCSAGEYHVRAQEPQHRPVPVGERWGGVAEEVVDVVLRKEAAEHVARIAE